MRFMLVAALLATPALAQPAPAQPTPPPTTAALAFLDGVWRGPATVRKPDGSTETLQQMERIGPMLEGAIRVMEGKGRDAAGTPVFGAFTVFTPQPDGRIEMQSWTAMDSGGRQDRRTITLLPEGGFRWEQALPTGTLRYVAVVRDGRWDETGEFVTPAGKAFPIFEMHLKREGDSDWPAAERQPLGLPPRR